MNIRAAALKFRMPVSLTALALASIGVAHAATITNGTFVSTGGSTEFGTAYGGNVVAGWSTSGYNFVFLNGATTAAGQYGNVSLPSSVLTNEPIGNYVALDAAFNSGPVTQSTVTGLSTTSSNVISFYYDDTAQVGFSGGPITLSVTLAGQTQTVSAVSGWTLETLTFGAASSSTGMLSFAASAPSGAPPFALIADVTSPTPTTTTPEPSSLGLLSTGLFGVAGFVRSRFKNKQ